MSVQRPLLVTITAPINWKMEAGRVPDISGYCFPAFRWVVGVRGVKAGEIVLQAYKLKFLLTVLFESKARQFDSLDSLLKAIAFHGWGEPPYLDEVFALAKETWEKFPGTANDPKGIFVELDRKWLGFTALN